MSFKYFSFFPEDSSYADIKKYCDEKGYATQDDIESDETFPEVWRLNAKSHGLHINKYIFIQKPVFSGQPESRMRIDPTYSPQHKNFLDYNDLYLGGDTSKKKEYETAKAEYQSFKKELEKVFKELKNKFGKSDKEISDRREDIISIRKNNGLDEFGNPIKKGLISKIFG